MLKDHCRGVRVRGAQRGQASCSIGRTASRARPHAQADGGSASLPAPCPGPQRARTPTAGWAPADRWTDDGRPLPGPAGCVASPPPPEQVSFKKPED